MATRSGKGPIAERSDAQIGDAELARLAGIAADDREARFARRRRWAGYKNRVLCVALCQGAALHYVDGRNKVKDLDVWTFYAEDETIGVFPYRWMTTADFGPSRFGRRAAEPGGRYAGRRVDLLGRSLAVPVDADPINSLLDYLHDARTESARRLAEKAVVIIEPADLRGTVVWPRAEHSRPE
jgi:hypothetical protein